MKGFDPFRNHVVWKERNRMPLNSRDPTPSRITCLNERDSTHLGSIEGSKTRKDHVVGSKVVKIAIQLVKSYDFTSQYRLNVLNHS